VGVVIGRGIRLADVRSRTSAPLTVADLPAGLLPRVGTGG
jgi:hypothetical protein